MTRLSSIESQPKKVVVVAVVVDVFVVGVGFVVAGGGVLGVVDAVLVLVVLVVIIVGHRNLTLQFGQNRVNIR